MLIVQYGEQSQSCQWCGEESGQSTFSRDSRLIWLSDMLAYSLTFVEGGLLPRPPPKVSSQCKAISVLPSPQLCERLPPHQCLGSPQELNMLHLVLFMVCLNV